MDFFIFQKWGTHHLFLSLCFLQTTIWLYNLSAILCSYHYYIFPSKNNKIASVLLISGQNQKEMLAYSSDTPATFMLHRYICWWVWQMIAGGCWYMLEEIGHWEGGGPQTSLLLLRWWADCNSCLLFAWKMPTCLLTLINYLTTGWFFMTNFINWLKVSPSNRLPTSWHIHWLVLRPARLGL